VTLIHFRSKTFGAMPACAGRASLLAIASAAGMIAFIGALMLTTVADVYVIYATVPFVTAGIAWLALSERASPAVLIASGVAFAGMRWPAPQMRLPPQFRDGSAIGSLSPPCASRKRPHMAELPALTWAKLELYRAMLETGTRRADLARRLGARAMGRELHIEMRPAA
jgi:hypothetical protein